jgi:hypothetical protein
MIVKNSRRMKLATAGSSLILFLNVCVLNFGLEAQQLAFPGAEGFGRFASGGRGGTVYEVTNLSDDPKNPAVGTLRYAVKQSGARTIIFRTSGAIALKDYLKITNGNITIAGQTAPGDGICLQNYSLSIQASNVIVRYIRCRFGDTTIVRNADGSPVINTTINKPQHIEDDAAHSLGTGDTNTTYRSIIVDHCSFSWAMDENASFYDVMNFTMQWCMISESMYHSFHIKGNHGYGGIWGGMGSSFHHNLLADNSSRNPRFCGARYHLNSWPTEIVDFRNNVIFNWGFNSAYGGESGRYNMVNNYYKSGPATSTGKYQYRIINPSDTLLQIFPHSKWYVSGNYIEGNTAVSADNWANYPNGGVQPEASTLPQDTFKLNTPLPVAPVTTQTAVEAFHSVVASAGCSLPVRDSADARVINEIQSGVAPYGATYNGGGKGIIDSPADVGGWPVYHALPAPVDSDHDGMPDTWEKSHGLNPNDSSDRNTVSANGYTMLEEYLNSISGQTGIVSVDDPSIAPAKYQLRQNFPNPFNPRTTITYEIPKSGNVSLKAYDIYGREIATLVDGIQSAGIYQVVLHGDHFSSGVYFVKLKTGTISHTIKLILAK